MKYLQTDVPGLVKDPTTGAVLNTSKDKLEAYRKQKKYLSSVNSQEERLTKLETDMGEIKDLLKILVERSK